MNNTKSSSSSSSSTTPLRASCDRCRAQKLRCVPSSGGGDATPPCQRCLKANLAPWCVFSRRLRTGRQTQTNNRTSDDDGIETRTTLTELEFTTTAAASSRSNKEKKEKRSSTPMFPGMRTFALEKSPAAYSSTSSNPGYSSIVELPSSSPPQMNNHGQQRTTRLDGMSGDDVGGTMEHVWGQDVDHDSRLLAFDPDILAAYQQDEPNSNSISAGAKRPDTSSVDEDVAGYLLGMQDAFSLSSLPPYHADMTMDMHLADWDTESLTAGTEKQQQPSHHHHPLGDLTGILADMSQYEAQLSNINISSSTELDNYPIGDAVFLSQRLYNILSNHGHSDDDDDDTNGNGATDTPSPQTDMSTCLLALSCYMTLTRIASFVLGYLHTHLSQLPNTHQQQQRHSGSYSASARRLPPPPVSPSASPPSYEHEASFTTMHTYRGLRLGQLQPCVCMCAGRETVTRAHSAISLLLESVGEVEALMGLPRDVRVITNTLSETAAKPLPQREGGRAGGRKGVIDLSEGGMLGLTNGGLYKNMRERARKLRGKIEETEDVLKGLLEIKAYFLTAAR